MTDITHFPFFVGQRVKLSDAGLHHFDYDNSQVKHNALLRGTVRGFGRDPEFVRVQRDGIKGADTYAKRFWEPA